MQNALRSLSQRTLFGVSLPAWAAMLAAAVVGLALRLMKLETLPFYLDEQNHTHAALLIMRGEANDYTRGLYSVTYPAILAFRLLGASWYSARLPMVLFNLLGVFPLYWVGKRFGRPAAILAVAFYLTNPWIIGSARNVREYALMGILFYVGLGLVLSLMETRATAATLTLAGFAREKWLALLGVAALMFYTLIIDPRGQFVLSLVYLPIGAAYYVYRRFSLSRNLWWMVGVIFGVLAALAGLVWRLIMVQKASDLAPRLPSLTYNPEMLQTLTQNAFQHNWWLAPMGWLVLVVILAVALYSLMRLADPWHRAFALASLGFFAIFTFITFVLGSNGYPVRVRYGILLEYSLPLLLAALLTKAVSMLPAKWQAGWRSPVIIAGLALLLLTNPAGWLQIYRYRGGQQFVVTGNNHFRGDEAYHYIAQNLQPGETVVSNRFYYNDEMMGNQWGDFNYININRLEVGENENFGDQLPKEAHGWIALYPESNFDIERYLKLRDFNSGNKQIRYLGKMGDVYVWDWVLK